MENTTPQPSDETFNKKEFNNFVKAALQQIEEIKAAYKKLFEGEGDQEALIADIENRLQEIQEEHDNLFQASDSGVSKIDELNAKFEDIKKYHTELLEWDSSIKMDIQDSQEKITDFYIYLFGNTEKPEWEGKKVKDAIKEIIDFHTELTEEDGYSDAINKAHSEITELHKDLFTKDENGISKSDRLNSDIQQIEKFSKELRDEIAPYLSATRTDIDTKKNEIWALLSNATVKTLAQGYLESMQTHGFTGMRLIPGNSKKDKAISVLISIFRWLWNLSINMVNYGLFIIPLITIGIIFVEPNFVKKFITESIGGASLVGTQYILYKISVSIPLLWISWYGQRNISHRNRLFEEYNHKLRVVQMYLLFISKEKSYDLADITRLEKILLDVIERNPAEVYGKDETMLDKIIEFIKAKKGIVDEVSKKVPNINDETE